MIHEHEDRVPGVSGLSECSDVAQRNLRAVLLRFAFGPTPNSLKSIRKNCPEDDIRRGYPSPTILVNGRDLFRNVQSCKCGIGMPRLRGWTSIKEPDHGAYRAGQAGLPGVRPRNSPGKPRIGKSTAPAADVTAILRRAQKDLLESLQRSPESGSSLSPIDFIAASGKTA